MKAEVTIGIPVFKSVDYTSLLVLKVSYLEDLCNKLISEIEELNKKIEK